MKRDTRMKIDKTADMIREDLQFKGADHLIDFINNIGGTVNETDELDYLIDGQIKKTGDLSFEIEMRKNQSPERKNFTLAHELGHLFLHFGYKYVPEKWNKYTCDNVLYRSQSNEMEYQANEFAAAFLMPEDEFRSYIDENAKNNHINMRDVARHFKVSYDAAMNRAKWLGILAW